MDMNTIPPVVAFVWPLLGHSLREHALLWQIVIGAIYVLGLRASAMQLDALEADIATAIRQTLARIQLPEKAAADLLGMHLNHFQQSLRRDEPYREISIFKLCRLPWQFWSLFLPTLSAIVLKHHIDDLIAATKEALAIERRQA